MPATDDERIRYWKAMLIQPERLSHLTYEEALDFLRGTWRELTIKGGCWESLSQQARAELTLEKNRLKEAFEAAKEQRKAELGTK